VPAAVTAVSGDITYSGDGSDLRTFINSNGGKTIYIPQGVYNCSKELYFDNDNTILKGAGAWYTEIHFTNTTSANGGGGLRANANNISLSGLYLSTVRNSRTDSYKAINGVYTTGSTITDIWAEHFECGAWIAEYSSGPAVSDGFTLSYCRFRNNYADGINLCKGTSNAIVEHCSFRNNGDDDMAIWSSEGYECRNNTFQYNTSEHCWRASGCAIYGGYSNVAHHLLIRDNLEVALRVNNTFVGVGFNDAGLHEFHDIAIYRCGTFNDLYNNPVGAIDISCTNTAGTRIKNVRFSNITLTDVRNDAIYIYKTTGEGFYNLFFENISVDGTGTEYPYNNAKNLTWGRGYGILFVGSPAGNGNYCNMSYTHRGGNATTNVNNAQIGTFSWTTGGCGTYITAPVNGSTFGTCSSSAITLAADATTTTTGTISKVEFFIDNVKIGEDLTAPYTYDWTSITFGNHQAYAKTTYSSPSLLVTSTQTNFSVAFYKGLLPTATAPTIDGTIESLWNTYTSEPIQKLSVGSYTSAADLSATYKVAYDVNNFYILADVTDDVLKNDGGNRYDNDQLEIFIDIGDDKKGNYDATDFTYNFVHNDLTVYETQHNAITGVTFKEAVRTGGYVMEIRIPWTTLGLAGGPASGALVGFDIHVDDDDDGGLRDAKKAWNDCTDHAWQNTSVFGTLEESGCTASVQRGVFNFTGSLVNGSAVLSWDYHEETNSHVQVLRAIGTGAFSTLYSMTSLPGTPDMTTNKTFTDNATPAGQITYRLEQLDVTNCNISMSDPIVLSLATDVNDAYGSNATGFYPNPFRSSGELKLAASSQETVSVRILDMNGRVLWTKDLPSNNSYTIGEQLSSGIYILELVDGISRQTMKLIKF
jgi:hypothetical protein